jgi:hypothetical protein
VTTAGVANVIAAARAVALRRRVHTMGVDQ